MKKKTKIAGTVARCPQCRRPKAVLHSRRRVKGKMWGPPVCRACYIAHRLKSDPKALASHKRSVKKYRKALKTAKALKDIKKTLTEGLK